MQEVTLSHFSRFYYSVFGGGDKGRLQRSRAGCLTYIYIYIYVCV